MPYRGMSEGEAESLAELVRRATQVNVAVVGDSGAFVVEVTGSAGRWTLYDEDDWDAWRSRIPTRVGTAVRARATRWLSDDQPGWVEVVIVDADGRARVIAEKAPVLGDHELSPLTSYPRDTCVPCEAGEDLGDGRVVVTLLHGITTTDGDSRLTVSLGALVRE